MNGPVEHNGKARNTDLEDKPRGFDRFLGFSVLLPAKGSSHAGGIFEEPKLPFRL